MAVGTTDAPHREYVQQVMDTRAEPATSGLYKLDRSDAVTSIGRFLRAASLDELRSSSTCSAATCRSSARGPASPTKRSCSSPTTSSASSCPPGMTGLWQVEARARATFREALDLDAAYARGWSLGLELVSARTNTVAGFPKGEDELMRRTVPKGRRCTRPLSVAVIGLGYWGPNLARNFAELEEAELSWLCDMRPEALATIARRYPAASTTLDYSEVLEDSSVDAVAIATHVSLHSELATAALRAGKHVFVEKPLASSSGDARRLIDLAERERLVLMPGHTFLYSPPVTKIKALIDDGELGDIYFISTSRVNLGVHQPDVSVIWDLGPHDFAILQYWLGELPERSRDSAAAASCPAFPTSRSSTSSTPRKRSRMSSCRGCRPASSGVRRSSARRRWSSTTTRPRSP